MNTSASKMRPVLGLSVLMAVVLVAVFLLPVQGAVASATTGGLSLYPDWYKDSSRMSATHTGDLNGDGYDDVALGRVGWGVPYDQLRVQVYYGSEGGLSPEPGWEGAPGHAFPAPARDINGDGYDDLLITAPILERIAIQFGSVDGLAPTPEWRRYNATNCGPAGDVNGDGYDDIKFQEGGVWGVYHGSPNGIGDLPDWTSVEVLSPVGDVNGDGFDDVWVGGTQIVLGSPMGLGDAIPWQPDIQYEAAGPAGDVNGDGCDDIIVGWDSWGYDDAAYVYYGSSEGPSATYDWLVEGEEPGSGFGYAVGSAGDINSDGYGDVIAGAPEAHIGGGEWPNRGRALVYLGSPDGLCTTAASMTSGDPRHGDQVGAAGDVNGDGYDDVLVYAADWDGPYLIKAAAVYHGGVQDWPTYVDEVELFWKPRGDKYKVRAFVAIIQEAENPVDGAEVTVELTLPDGRSLTRTGITNQRGRAEFQAITDMAGTAEACVTGIDRDGYYYDPGQNRETCDTVAIP